MRIIDIVAGQPITIGRMGENDAAQVRFPIADWLETYGSGNFSVLVQRFEEEAPYAAATVTADAEYVYWTVDNTDTGVEGPGMCELILTVGDKIAKSVVYRTVVQPSLSEPGEAPEPWESWVDEVIAAGAQAVNAIQKVTGATAGNVPALTADGSLEDSGIASGSVAQQDGYYSGMTVGAAETLIGRGDGVVSSYTLQSAGGDADIEDGTATIQAIRGNTLVWNQLVTNGNFATADGWAGLRCSLTAADNVLSAEVTQAGGRVDLYLASASGFRVVAGHRYFVAASVNTPQAETLLLMLSQTQTANAGNPVTATPDTWTRVQSIITADTDIEPAHVSLTVRLGVNGMYSVGDVIQVRNVIVMDLTRMFGQGKEPAMVSDFTGLYPMEWYDADAGSFLHFNGSGIRSTGFNAYDLENHIARVVAATDENNGYRISGAYTSVTFSRTSSGTFAALPVTTYTDAAGNLVRRILPPANGYVKISGADATTCLNLIWSGYRDEDFEAFWSQEKAVPSATYFAAGMRSAGSARDEMTLNKAAQRIGALDMGSLTWGRITTYANPLFYADISGKAAGMDNLLTLDYLTTPVTFSAMADRTMRGSTSSATRIVVRDDRYTTAADFKTAVTGKTLLYEMASPVEATISPVLDMSLRVSDFGLEELLPENTADPTTAPCNLIMLYGTNVQDAIRRLPQNYISRKSWNNIASELAGIGIEIALTYDADGAAYIAALTDNRDNRLVDVPASATAAGTAGTYAVDPTGGYLYVCMTTGEDGSAAWMRVQMSAWT